MSAPVRSVAETITFADLCSVLDAIKASPKKDQKEAKLANFIKEYREKGQHLSEADPDVETSLYPLLRLLLPQCERERSAYGIKEVAFAKSITRILGLPPFGEDAKNLTGAANGGGDFGEAAYEVLRKHFSGSKRLSIADINEKLDAVSRKNSENDIRGQEDEIFKLFKSTSPNEQRWLVGIIVKRLSLTLGRNKILQLFHPDAVDLFDNNNSLAKTCEVLHDPSVRTNEIGISLFAPFRPMLSQRCDAKELLKVTSGGDAAFLVETKFDGERFQLHMSDGSFKYFSRNGYEYTRNYGADFTAGVFTPYLKDAFAPEVRSVILDGEMMGWDTVKKKFGSKGMTFDVKKLLDTSRYQPCFCVFDVILLNGKILTNTTFAERAETLKSILRPVEGVIVISEKTEVKTKQEIIDALNSSMDRYEEGIVFKDPRSSYVPNNRKGGWWKVKLEYFANVMSDLDVVLLGAFRKGRRLAAFLVGVAEACRPGVAPTKFLSFAKVGTGLTNDELDSLDKKLAPHWKEWTSADDCAKSGVHFGKDRPNIWVEPKNSCVLLLRGTELTKLHGGNPDFKIKYTLRFPRILSVRYDKPYYDCLNTSELDELTTGRLAVQKLHKRHLDMTDVELEVEKTKKRKTRFRLPQEDEGVKPTSDLLKGREFYVLSGTKDWGKLEVEKAIRQSGGTVVKMEGRNTFCMLLGDDHPRVQYYKGPVDIVKLSWLTHVLDGRRFIVYKPRHVVYAGPYTKNRFMSEYDKYGDSYTEKATLESVDKAFENIRALGHYMNPTTSEIDDLHDVINFPFQFGAFRDVNAYFDKFKVINHRDSEMVFSSDTAEADFRFWGGSVSDYLSVETDLVVAAEAEHHLRTEVIDSYLEEIHNENAIIVTPDYINETVSEYRKS